MDQAFVVAEPRTHGGSPRIYAGEERFSAPKTRPTLKCALALGSSEFTRFILQLGPNLRHDESQRDKNPRELLAVLYCTLSVKLIGCVVPPPEAITATV
jgi:hypothetical protein